MWDVCAHMVDMVLFIDNAHITQDRLILLDAQLVFFIALTLYAYVRFRKLRYQYVSPFFFRPSFRVLTFDNLQRILN